MLSPTTFGASLLEVESVRFGVTGGREGPGPGSYDLPDNGVAGDKRKWLVTGSWAREESVGVKGATPSPGPAAYDVLGEKAVGCIGSPKTKIGTAPRFKPAGTSGGAVHAYQSLSSHDQNLYSSFNGTFSTSERVIFGEASKITSPGPKYKYDVGTIGNPDANPIHATAPRFPAVSSVSPGPVYALLPPRGHGPKLPPKPEKKLFEKAFGDAKAWGGSGAKKRHTPREGSSPRLTKALVAGKHPRLGAGPGPVFKQDLGETCYGTVRPSKESPGPQQYSVNDSCVKRKTPAFSFYGAGEEATRRQHRARKGQLSAAGGGGGGGVGGGGGGSDDPTSAPGPGSYFVESASTGPAFTIASPLPEPVSNTPAPTAYDPRKYKKTNKPHAPTFSRSERFPTSKSVADTPGPGYYRDPPPLKKAAFQHGMSRECPDVVGWIARKRESEAKKKDCMQNAARRMVVARAGDEYKVDGSDESPVQQAGLERPQGKMRTIWY